MIDTTVTVWGRLNSANVQKVLWCLADLQVAYRIIPAGGVDGGLDTDDFAKLNPNKLVPVLVDKGVALWESNVIVRYLCKQYGAQLAYRDDPLQQALEERWVDWYGTELGGLMTSLWGHFKRGKTLEPALLTSRLERAAQLWDIIDRELADRIFIGGKSPGVADYSLGAAVHRWASIRGDAVSANVSRWYQALAARPVFERHITAAPL
ncbi:glutathione S-transferase family protein [Pandoraea pneumonica]|uniref:glutathione S-transferase family protein n=1 Tax=Pandoraea pneumonica TaxID=2508299 RepID=UPI003CEF32A2